MRPMSVVPIDPEDLVIFRDPACTSESIAFWARFDERPDLVDEHPALLAQAREALARRQQAYPALIAKGEVTEQLAQADIAGWHNLVQEWDWIVSGSGEAPHPLTLRGRVAAVDLALDRIEAELGRSGGGVAGGRRTDLLRQQALNQALRWHLGQLKFDAPAVHFWAECTRQARQRAGARALEICGTCDRRAADPVTTGCTRTDCGLTARIAAQVAA